jgi:hypothetical protein
VKQEEKAPERYFYHSFPRRMRATTAEIEKGCQILSIMRDVGLVMAPEVVTWGYEHADGSGVHAKYRCQCFSNLEVSVARYFGSGGGRARSPRRSAASDRRPMHCALETAPVG